MTSPPKTAASLVDFRRQTAITMGAQKNDTQRQSAPNHAKIRENVLNNKICL